MQDGFGRVDYEYDEVSRLTAETRRFSSSLTDAPQSANGFRTSYSYHLGGSLKSVAYPNQIALNYGLTRTGQAKSISGTSEGEALSIVSDVKYRAWGGVKKIEYGNGTLSELTYNNRLLPNTEKYVGKKQIYGNFVTQTMVDNQYSYYADGAIKLIEDKLPAQTNLGYNYYNRLHKYDVMGRLIKERSGSEALGTGASNKFTKYGNNFSYDVWGNLKTEQTARGYYSSGGEGDSLPQGVQNYTTVNNRVTAGYNSSTSWEYDRDGRLTRSYGTGGAESKYDVAGYLVEQKQGKTIQTLWYDGDGNISKTKDIEVVPDDKESATPTNHMETTHRYVIRSSVLGETVVFQNTQDARYPTSQSKETKSWIYGMGGKIGMQSRKENVVNAPGGILKKTDLRYNSAFEAKRLSSEISSKLSNGLTQVESISTRGLELSNIRANSGEERGSYAGGRWEVDFSETFGCQLDGVDIPCLWANRLARNSGESGGAYVRCPNDDCGPRGATDRNGNRTLTGGFAAQANGSGYWVPQWGSRKVNFVGEPRPEGRPEILGWDFVQVGGASESISWNVSQQARDTGPLDPELLDFVRPFLESAVNRPTCKDFIDKYADGVNLVDVFDKVREQRGFVQVPLKKGYPYSAFADLSVENKKGAQIQFNNNPDPYPAKRIASGYFQTRIFVSILIHELIHVAGNGKDDAEMSQRLFKAGASKIPPPTIQDFRHLGDLGAISKAYVYANSSYWNAHLQNACLVPDEEFEKWWRNWGEN